MAEKNPGRVAAFLSSLGRRSAPRRTRGVFDFLKHDTDNDHDLEPPLPPLPPLKAAECSSSEPTAAAARRSESSASNTSDTKPPSPVKKVRMPIIAETSHPNLLSEFLKGAEGIEDAENRRPDVNVPSKQPLHQPSASKHSRGSNSYKSRHQTIASAHSAPSRRTVASFSTRSSVDMTRYESTAASSLDTKRQRSKASSSLDVSQHESESLDLKFLAENRPASVPSAHRPHITIPNSIHIEIYIRAGGSNDFIRAPKADLIAASPVLRDRIASLDGSLVLDLTNFSQFIIVRIIDWAILGQFSFNPSDTAHIANPAYDLYAAATDLLISNLRARMRSDFSALFPDRGPCHYTCTDYLRVLHRFFCHATAEPAEQSELLALVTKAVNRFSFGEIARAAAALPPENSPGAQMYRHLILAKGERDETEPTLPPPSRMQSRTPSQTPPPPMMMPRTPVLSPALPVNRAEIDRRRVATPPAMFTRPGESPRFRGEWRMPPSAAIAADNRRRRNSHA